MMRFSVFLYFDWLVCAIVWETSPADIGQWISLLNEHWNVYCTQCCVDIPSILFSIILGTFAIYLDF